MMINHSPATLHFTDLMIERRHNMVFEHLSGEINSGELLQINGPNGCGKSTLLRLLSGFLRSETGEISWNHNNIHNQLDDYTQQLHYLGHDNGLKLNLTLIENINLYCTLNNCSINSLALRAIIEKLNLARSTNTRVHHLSAGQQRRLSLAKLLINPKPLWILDEPNTALDHSGQLVFVSMLEAHLQQAGMIIIATHQPLLMSVTKKEIQLGCTQ
jgi:heme exporter protein A